MDRQGLMQIENYKRARNLLKRLNKDISVLARDSTIEFQSAILDILEELVKRLSKQKEDRG